MIIRLKGNEPVSLGHWALLRITTDLAVAAGNGYAALPAPEHFNEGVK